MNVKLNRTTYKCGITAHPLENEDLRQIYFILTYSCNKNCPFCIEPNVHTGKFMNQENFVKGLKFAKEKDLKILYLHGGDPPFHPEIVKYAKLAKEEGFQVNMFTNGIKIGVIKELDGIVDEIRFSYVSSKDDFMLLPQKDWKSRIKLCIMATPDNYPKFSDIYKVARKALDLGMETKIRTLNPVNPYAYKNQFVPYLHERLLKMPESEIICYGNIAAYRLKELDNIVVRLGNMQLNPGHLKFSVDTNGKLRDHFEHRDKKLIVKTEEIESEKAKYADLINRLRNI